MSVAIIVISFNHFLFTKYCIESIIKCTDRRQYKLCLVDNGSTDGTKDWANDLLSKGVLDNFISNSNNLGACKASNQGTVWALNQEDVEYITIMANDHVVTKDWLEPLLTSPFDCTCPFVFHSVRSMRNLFKPIGPVIDKYKPLRLKYLQKDDAKNMSLVLEKTYGSLEVFAENFKKSNNKDPYKQSTFVIWPGLIFYKRKVFDVVGLKDEEYLKFDLASYSDIDHYVRVYLTGFIAGVAMTSYIHHWGSITTRKLGLCQEKTKGYVNKETLAYKYFIKKWGCNPHDLSSIVKRGQKLIDV